MLSSGAQVPFLAARMQYRIFQNFWGRKEITRKFSNWHISNHHKPRAHCV
jgi:hypothetical protein